MGVKVAERAVLVEEREQRTALDRDVPQRLGNERVDEDGLPRQEVQLPKEARGAVPDELVPGRVDDRNLAFKDRNERIGAIADPVQQLTGRRRALLADLGQSRELRRGEQWARGCDTLVPPSQRGRRSRQSCPPGPGPRGRRSRFAPFEKGFPLGEEPTTVNPDESVKVSERGDHSVAVAVLGEEVMGDRVALAGGMVAIDRDLRH